MEKKVKAFTHSWLDMLIHFKSITNPCILSDQLMVSEMLENGKWKKNFIEVLFAERDRELIYGTLIYPTGEEDRLIWNYTPRVRF